MKELVRPNYVTRGALHALNQNSTNIRRLFDCSLCSGDVVVLDYNEILLIDGVEDRFRRESKHTAMVAAGEDDDFVLACVLPCRHQSVKISFRARVRESHSVERKALADQGSICDFVLGVGTQVGAIFLQSGFDGVDEDGLRMTVESSRVLPEEVCVSACRR
jgi:hypothetical protein